MPYINQSDRPQYRNILKQLGDIKTKGDLEYCIMYLLLKFKKTRDVRYTELHDATYAAYHCGHEFRRWNLDIREDAARAKNGDVEVD